METIWKEEVVAWIIIPASSWANWGKTRTASARTKSKLEIDNPPFLLPTTILHPYLNKPLVVSVLGSYLRAVKYRGTNCMRYFNP